MAAKRVVVGPGRKISLKALENLPRAILEARIGLPLLSTKDFKEANPVPGAIAAFDVGDTYIGVAISDAEQRVAFPCKGLFKRGRGTFKELAAQIHSELQQHNITGVVVGYPLTLDRIESTQCLKTLHFLRNLKRPEGVPIKTMHLFDETYSSVQAREELRSLDITGVKVREHVDHLVASILLQSFLDHIHRKRKD